MKKNNKLFHRRGFLASGLAVGGASLLFSCKDNSQNQKLSGIIQTKANTFNLKMITTWPKDFPGLGTSANRLADKINKASKGQINIKVRKR